MKKFVILLVLIFCSFNAISQETWTFQDSKFKGWIKGIHFPNAQTGYAVGEGGIIMKTTDGGTTWKSDTLVSRANLYSVHFTDVNTGFFTTDGSNDTAYIYKTTNGGQSWSSKAYAPGSYFYRVKFFSNSMGWLLGAGKYGTILAKSSDGGDTWVNLSKSTMIPLGISFTDPTTGFVCGSEGNIKKTIDGGQNWSSLTNSNLEWLEDMQFVTATDGFAVGRGGIVLKTTNGGTVWSKLETGLTDDFFGLHFLNATTGWIVGGVQGSAKILKTTNGGTNWTTIFQSDLNDYFLSINFLNNSTGWVSGDRGKIYKYSASPLYTISSPSLATANYCKNNSISVPFAISGKFNQGNIFSLQLSDDKGSFAKPVILGTLEQTISGTIAGVIGDSILASPIATYKVRVVSTDPAVLGAPSPTAIRISNYPLIFNVNGGGEFCEGKPGVSVDLSGSETGVSYQLILNDTTFLNKVTGTGTNISFGLQNKPGKYTVSATTLNSSCSKQMTNSATIYTYPKPAKPNITKSQNKLKSSSISGNQWFIDGIPMKDSTQQEISLSLKGLYQVQVTLLGCTSDLSDGVQFDPINSVNDLQSGDFEIYPSPASDYIFVENKDIPISSYKIMNLTGELIIDNSIIVSSNKVRIDISKLLSGSYILELKSNSKSIKRIISVLK